MKIFLVILYIASSSLAIPASPGHRLSKKEVATASESGSNLIETGISLDPGSNDTQKHLNETSDKIITSEQLQEKLSTTIITSETQVSTKGPENIQGQNFSAPFHHDEFKVRILDLNNAKKPEGLGKLEVSLDLPTNQAELQIIKVPQLYIIKEPQVVIAKDADFLSNSRHDSPKFTGPFYPFQEFPAISDDFSNDENTFGISDISPIYPIEIPQEAGHYPIIGGGGDIIPVIPDVGEISQGFLQPDVANSFPFTDEKIDHESDSITIEAVSNSGKIPKGFNIPTNTTGGSNDDKKSEVVEKSDSKTTKV